MLCKAPFRKDGQRYPCGQCLPCRLNRRRLWTHRLLLEAQSHELSCFPTLTYSPENVPTLGNGAQTLDPRHTELWLKRLRSKLGTKRPVRYYLVGEYGDRTQRPHYHAALFGVAACEKALIESAWGMGMVYVGELTPESAQYIAGYVTKKMTAKDDSRLNGRHPEFARMSLRPGIGAHSVPAIASALNTVHGAALVAQGQDVPLSLNHGRKSLPLGRYLRRKLREEMGFDDVSGASGQAVRRLEEVLKVRAHPQGTKGAIAQEEALEKVRILQVETKARIYAKKGSL